MVSTGVIMTNMSICLFGMIMVTSPPGRFETGYLKLYFTSGGAEASGRSYTTTTDYDAGA